MNHAPTRIIHRPEDADGRRVWRLDPNALDPAFPFARASAKRRYGSLIGAGIVALAVVAGIFGATHEILPARFIGGSGIFTNMIAALISLPLVVLIAVFGWRGTHRWCWIDRATGLEAQRVSIRRPGDIDQAARMTGVVHARAAGDPRAPSLVTLPPLVPGERLPRPGAEVCISVYVPDARAFRSPCLVTTAVLVPELTKRGQAIVLPQATVNRAWAEQLLISATTGVAGTDMLASGDAAGSGWYCDDGSASGCGDSGAMAVATAATGVAAVMVAATKGGSLGIPSPRLDTMPPCR